MQRSGFRDFLFSRTGIATLGFLAIAGYFLWTEHRVHLFTYWPFLLLLACPLLHFFHHGGHGGHGEEHSAHKTNNKGAGDRP